MLNKEYPLHDMNVVFDMIESSIAKGGTHEKAAEEMNLLMHLYAGLPAEAVEEGMKFIHGRACEIPSTSDIIPLHVRLMNLLEYLEKIEYLALVSENIKDASELSKMKQLIYLDLSGNPLSDISFLKYLEKLQILKLVDTKVSDFSVLNGLSDLKYLYISHDVLDKALEYIDTSRIDLVIKK